MSEKELSQIDDLPMAAIDMDSPIDSDTDKIAMLRAEKEKAVNEVIYKTASFNGGLSQDPYPSPFLNLSDTRIPGTVNEIYKWCKYFFTFDPLISGSINALAAFPVTEIFYEDRLNNESDDESQELLTYKRVINDQLQMHRLLIEIGIDYYLYGNCFVFGEMWDNPATGEKEWKTMVRLDPSKMIIDYNPSTQKKTFKWEVPASIKRIVRKKAPKSEYDKIPEIVKQAVLKKGVITLNNNCVYHFPRPSDSMGENAVWGVPIVANVLKLLMYRNTLRQSQEAIAREHIVPMRLYSLQRDQNYDPTTDWNATASNLAGELMKATKDPNYKVVSPVPVNVTNVGGHGRSLLLTPEIEQVQSEILAGMNIPREFIFGGVSYSSSSISLKILENQFITYRLAHKDFLQNFVIKGMARARKEWLDEKDDDSLIRAGLMDLKMQDDVQQKQVILQLNQAGKVTDEHMWKTMGMDPDKMKEAIEKEELEKIDREKDLQIKKIEAQIEIKKAEIKAEIELQKYQQEMSAKEGIPQEALGGPQGQTGMPQPGMPQEQGQQGQPEMPQGQPEQPSDDERAVNIAKSLLNKSQAEITQFLSNVPEYHRSKIQAAMEQIKAEEKPVKIEGVDMRPLPEQRPPRRKSLQ